MSESNSSKKRKLICHEEEDHEEDEAKMETFFALVRNIRDKRDRWMDLRSGDSKSKRGKTITAKEGEDRVWKPTFQLEDFADEQGRCQNSNKLSASRSKNCDIKEEAEEKGIDLSLSL